MTPLDQFIADPATPECVRTFLNWARFEAANDEAPPPLFANWRECRVRVVTAKPTAFVGVTVHFGSVAPQRFISLAELDAFLTVPYRRNPFAVVLPEPDASHQARLDDCCDRAGLDVDDLTMRVNLQARCFTVAELHTAGANKSQISQLLGINRFLIRIALEKAGLDPVDDVEHRCVRSIWTSGPKRIGTATGEIPPSVAERIVGSGWAVQIGDGCDAALRHRFPSTTRAAA